MRTRPRPNRSRLVMLFVIGLWGCATPRTNLTLSLRDSEHFRARVEHPKHPNGAGVLLLAGGYSNDLDWTTPGSVLVDGREVPLTISGRAYADAPALTRAMTDAGFVVMRYSSIPDGGPRRSEANAGPLPFTEGLDLAHRALSEFRRTPGVDRIYLVGHSLGGTRAALIADESIAGFVFLAGAYLSRTAESPQALSNDASDQDVPNAVDLDTDGFISPWEKAAAIFKPSESPAFRGSLPWPIDRLESLNRPVLAVFGGLDPISVHGPSLARLPRAEVRYLPNLGHQLSAEAQGEMWPLVGPISPEVISRCTRWLTRTDRELRVKDARP